MSDLPAWAYIEARKTYFESNMHEIDYRIETIARALVAERERARSIAKVAWLTCDFGSIADADTMNDLSEHIADLIDPDSAIRNQEPER